MKKTNYSNIILLNADEFNANNNINEYDSVVASNSLANYGFVAINTDTNDVVDDEDILEEIYEGEMKNKCFTKNYSVKLNGLSREEMADAIEKVIAIEGNAYQFNHEQRDYSNITLHFKFSGLSDCFTAIFLDVVKYNENGEERWLINIYGSKRGRSENLYHAKDIIPDGNYAFPFKEAKSAMEQTFGFSMVNGFDNKEMHDEPKMVLGDDYDAVKKEDNGLPYTFIDPHEDWNDFLTKPENIVRCLIGPRHLLMVKENPHLHIRFVVDYFNECSIEFFDTDTETVMKTVKLGKKLQRLSAKRIEAIYDAIVDFLNSDPKTVLGSDYEAVKEAVGHYVNSMEETASEFDEDYDYEMEKMLRDINIDYSGAGHILDNMDYAGEYTNKILGAVDKMIQQEVEKRIEEWEAKQPYQGFDTKEMHDKCLDEIRVWADRGGVDDVSYDEDGFDVNIDGCHLFLCTYNCSLYGGIDLDEYDLRDISELIDCFYRGYFDEFIPSDYKEEVA